MHWRNMRKRIKAYIYEHILHIQIASYWCSFLLEWHSSVYRHEPLQYAYQSSPALPRRSWWSGDRGRSGPVNYSVWLVYCCSTTQESVTRHDNNSRDARQYVIRVQLGEISLSSKLPEHFVCASYGTSFLLSDVTVVPGFSPYSTVSDWRASSSADSSLISHTEPSLGLPSIATGEHLLFE